MQPKIDLNFDQQHLWHPYTSMIEPLPCYPVSHADGVYIHLETGEKLIDGMSSWWSVIHGYNHPVLNAALHNQVDQMSHVMFGGLTHEPAVSLAKKLVAMTPSQLTKVFLADSGSVSVEVALKMALQYWMSRNEPHRNKFLTIEHGYHGDTFGAMSVCDPQNSMHSLYAGVLPQHLFAKAPQSRFEEAFDQSDLDDFAAKLQENKNQIAAVILEPIVQGAGGMRIYHPEFLRGVKQLCEQYQVLFICDEIATGFGRTGKLFACEHARIEPDILCLGKALTGGYLSLAATLCTNKVAEVISQGQAGVLMHGPTFMGNPLACAVANASLSLLIDSSWQEQVCFIESCLKSELQPLRGVSTVADIRVLGAIGVVEMRHTVDVKAIQRRFVEAGVWIRPFGKLIYIMPPYVISQSELSQLCKAIRDIVVNLE